MSDEAKQAVATWAARGLPARLDAAATAKLLGFAEHDIQILMRVGKLTPLGEPAPNAPKWFAAIDMIRLAADHALGFVFGLEALEGFGGVVEGVVNALATEEQAVTLFHARDVEPIPELIPTVNSMWPQGATK